MRYIELEGMKLYKVEIWGNKANETRTSDYVEVLALTEGRARAVAIQRLKDSPHLEGVTDRRDIRVKQVSSDESQNYPIIVDGSGLVKCLSK